MNSKYIVLPVIRGTKEISILWPILQKNNVMICGGYARYCLSQQKTPPQAKDIDLFPQSENSYTSLVTELNLIGFKIKHENDLSITYSSLESHSDPRWLTIPTIQVIKPVKEGEILTVGNMEDILNNFDFSVTRVGLISLDEGLADEDFVKDDLKSIINIKNIHCPVSSLLRCVKYCKKGFRLKSIETFKLFQDWDNRSLEYKSRLLELITKYNEFGSENINDEITSDLESNVTISEEKTISQKELDEMYKLMSVD